MKKGYLCEDRKHLNITGENIDGLYDEPYLSSVEWINVAEIADKAALDYSIFKSLKEIMISSLEPYTFPKEICYLPRLEHISCSGACLVPPEIGEMAGLQRLDVTGDCVLQMPDSLAKASSLKMLTVSYYEESAPCPMPGWISTLTQLQALYLHLCKFTAIDAAINNLANLETLCLWSSLSAANDFPALTNLKKLNRLGITGSGFSGAPKPPYCLFAKVLNGITALNTLTSLELSEWRSRKKADYLVVTEKGRSIPDIFNHFPNLTNLDISGMGIDFLPPSIFQLPELERIGVRGNKLSEECLEDLKKRGIDVYS